MERQLWSLVMLVLILAGQACEVRGLSSVPGTTTENARTVMMLRVRLGEGFRDNTVIVRIDGKEVYRKSGVNTNYTISYAGAVDVPTEAPTVRLEVAVEGGPNVAQDIRPGQTPFVEVRLADGALQFLPLNTEPPMM